MPESGRYEKASQPVAVTERDSPKAGDSHDSTSHIKVRVRHPFLEGEVTIALPRHAKFKHVKRALAKVLGNDSILHRGELMWKERGRYRGYKDGSYVGDVNEVLVTSTDFSMCGGGHLEASLDDGEVSMDDEYIEIHRVRSTGSTAGVPAKTSFAPGARAELTSGIHVGKAGIIVEVFGTSGMLTLKLEGSKLVHAVKAADCRLVEQQDQTDSPEETIERLMRIREEPEERYSSSLEALQLGPGASDSEIAKQYRRLSMRIHPDKCCLPNASAAFQVLVRAHNRVKGQRGLDADRPAAQEVGGTAGVEDGLTLRRALALLGELRSAFAEEAFRARLSALEFQRDCYGSTSEYLRDRNALFATVHSAVLPRHGFEGTRSGVYRMLSQMAGFAENEEFRSMATELNELLGVDLLPKRWERVAKACKRHGDVESGRRPLPGRGYCSLLLGDASRGALGGFLALAGRACARAEPSAPPAQSATEDLSSIQPWPACRGPPFRLFIVGSWSGHRPEVMRWESGLFLHQVVVTRQGTERFHLLKNGSVEGVFHPDREDASPFEGFEILGPGSEGRVPEWRIGKYAEEGVQARSRLVVVVALDSQGILRTVDWQPGQLKPFTREGSVSCSPSATADLRGGTASAGSRAQPDECLLPWEAGGSGPSWDLDAIGA